MRKKYFKRNQVETPFTIPVHENLIELQVSATLCLRPFLTEYRTGQKYQEVATNQ